MSVLEPNKIPVPFANSGLKNSIPANSDPVTGKAGYNQGFPAINMIAKEAGGIPPYGQDFNGILFDITAAIRFTQQGGIYTYNASFATAIGGYTKGAVLCGKNTTSLYQNQVDGNTTDPESSGSANWARFGPNSYGLPMIGELVFWPNANMPQDIWPDIGAKFIPYMAQAFSKTLYPILAQIHPSGVLPADMRGEFPRGWDNGRGLDPDRELMSAQGSDNLSHMHYDMVAKGGTPGGTPLKTSAYSKAFYPPNTPEMFAAGPSGWGAFANGLISSVSGGAESRPRNISWNLIVRAS